MMLAGGYKPMDFMLAGANAPFAVALMLMVALALIEAVGMMLGGGVSHWFENLFHIPHADIDADLAHPHGALEKMVGWLHLGRVPLLILLTIFLACFAAAGLVLQHFALSALGNLLPAWIAIVPAAAAGFLGTRVCGGGLARVMPNDETSSVSEKTLIGRVGVITLGIARGGQPAEVRLRDANGQTHYVMAEPDVAGEEFAAGKEVLLVRQTGATYRCIGNPHPAES